MWINLSCSLHRPVLQFSWLQWSTWGYVVFSLLLFILAPTFFSHLLTSCFSGEYTEHVFCSLIYICFALSESFPSPLSYLWIIKCWQEIISFIPYGNSCLQPQNNIFKRLCFLQPLQLTELLPHYWYFIPRNLTTSLWTYGIMLIKEERPATFLSKTKKAFIFDLLKLNNILNFSMHIICRKF